MPLRTPCSCKWLSRAPRFVATRCGHCSSPLFDSIRFARLSCAAVLLAVIASMLVVLPERASAQGSSAGVRSQGNYVAGSFGHLSTGSSPRDNRASRAPAALPRDVDAASIIERVQYNIAPSGSDPGALEVRSATYLACFSPRGLELSLR